MKLPGHRDDPVWERLRQHDLLELWDPKPAPHVAAAYRGRIALLWRLLAEHLAPPARVLDVGCAQGTLGLLLAEAGYSVTLLDIRTQAIEYARERYERGDVEFVVGTLDPDRPSRNDYDVVVCTEVLEHVHRPCDLLQALASKARPAGLLLLTTPNGAYSLSSLPSFSSATQAVIDTAPPNSMDGDAHRYLYTQAELIALVRGIGLRVLGAGFFSPFWLEGHLKTRLLHRSLRALTGRLLNWRSDAAFWPSRTCSAQWLLARRAP